MRTPIRWKEIPEIGTQSLIASLLLFEVFCALADYILDPFSQLDGSDIDG